MSLQLAVIIPGPTEKKKIDKTAEKLSQNPQLRDKLIGKLAFLDEDHEFHPYFLQQLQQAKIHQQQAASAAASGINTNTNTNNDNNNNKNQNDDDDQQQNQIHHHQHQTSSSSSFVEYTKDPLPDDFSVPLVASGVPQLEMDLIQLAAQHAAVYGDLFLETARANAAAAGGGSSSSDAASSSSFASSSSSTSGRRYYDFLNPQHPRFAIFEKFRQAYVRILGAVAAGANPDAAAVLLDSPSTSTDVSKALTQTGKNNLISRLELLAGETPEDPKADKNRAREAFLVECNTKRSYMVQEDLRRRTSQLTDAELRNRLTWDQFVVQKKFSFEDLKLKSSDI